jgi:hypothetical protein
MIMIVLGMVNPTYEMALLVEFEMGYFVSRVLCSNEAQSPSLPYHWEQSS